MHIYLDMDGVIADFEQGVRNLMGREPVQRGESYESVTRFWQEANKIPHFYDRIPPMRDAENLVRELEKRAEITVLTGVPRPEGHFVTAPEDKSRWFKREMQSDAQVITCFRTQKKNYVTGKDAVLIDDNARSVQEWKEQGGSAILYTGFQDAIRQLDAIEKALGEKRGLDSLLREATRRIAENGQQERHHIQRPAGPGNL